MKLKKDILVIYYLIFIISTLNAQVSEIPFELGENGHVYLKVIANDTSKELKFIFDTGATSDLLNSTTAKKMGMKSNYQQEVKGAGESKTYDIVLNQKLTLLQNIEINNTHLVLADLSSLNEVLDKNVDGIIGYSLLSKYVTKIDYENKKLILYKEIKDVDVEGYNAIPFQFGDGIPIPQFDISFTLSNGITFTNTILFDSGAGLSLLVNAPFNRENQINEKAGKSLIFKSVNLNSESISEEIAIKSLTLGKFKFEELTALISYDTEGVSSWEGYLGILGATIIERFNIILDYNSKILYLKPNNNFGNEFDFPLSGIKLKKINNKIIIGYLDETTPAYKSGIREGDQLISINGETYGDKKLYYELLKKEGNEVTLKIINQNGEYKVIYIIEKIIINAC
ncbi:MAG: retroviral aspartyl protease [Candidatus Atribacteria bacterium]|nr:MAG: retroviral aspartyl protease [Candidatus Atribacteria bacterium]